MTFLPALIVINGEHNILMLVILAPLTSSRYFTYWTNTSKINWLLQYWILMHHFYNKFVREIEKWVLFSKVCHQMAVTMSSRVNLLLLMLSSKLILIWHGPNCSISHFDIWSFVGYKVGENQRYHTYQSYFSYIWNLRKILQTISLF